MKCQGKTKAGKPCGYHANTNGYCKHHQDQAAQEVPQTDVSEKDAAYTLAADRRKEDRRECKEELEVWAH